MSEDPTAWKERQHELKMGCPACGGVDTIITRKTSGSIQKHCSVDECLWEYSTTRKDDYSWVTDEMFDEAFEVVVDAYPASLMLRLPGVYDVLKESLNNDVLSWLVESRGEEE